MQIENLAIAITQVKSLKLYETKAPTLILPTITQPATKKYVCFGNVFIFLFFCAMRICFRTYEKRFFIFCRIFRYILIRFEGTRNWGNEIDDTLKKSNVIFES